jgi:two-component system response regulator GlrR
MHGDSPSDTGTTVAYSVLGVTRADSVVVPALGDAGRGVAYQYTSWEELQAAAERVHPQLIVFDATCAVPADAVERVRALQQCATIAIVPSEDDVLIGVADDFVIAHGDIACELRCRVRRLLGDQPDLGRIAVTLANEAALRQLVGTDPKFLEVLRLITLYAPSDAPILILGETGTGKELCARALHHLGPRRHHPFVAVDCSALPDHLFENEVFGHARGAYTDAASDQKGLIALASQGTLFLDEIDTLSLSAQGKLLRFLQEKTYKTLGGEKFLRADVNVIAATNGDLDGAIRIGRFRADLFYRINVLRIHMPPLRERRTDIALLARSFLAEAAERYGRRRVFSAAALRKLASYDWPGNVRELSNLVQRAAVLAEGETVLPAHIVLPSSSVPVDASGTFRAERRRIIESFERSYVQELLSRHSGNITHAAREAGQERRAFGKLAKKYHLTR